MHEFIVPHRAFKLWRLCFLHRIEIALTRAPILSVNERASTRESPALPKRTAGQFFCSHSLLSFDNNKYRNITSARRVKIAPAKKPRRKQSIILLKNYFKVTLNYFKLDNHIEVCGEQLGRCVSPHI